MEELHGTNFDTEEDNFLNVQSLRGITKSVAFPDQFTEQNVGDAKKSFAISHQLKWMTNRLNCEQGFFNSAIEKHDGSDGSSGEILQEKLFLVKSRIAAIPDDHP